MEQVLEETPSLQEVIFEACKLAAFQMGDSIYDMSWLIKNQKKECGSTADISD